MYYSEADVFYERDKSCPPPPPLTLHIVELPWESFAWDWSIHESWRVLRSKRGGKKRRKQELDREREREREAEWKGGWKARGIHETEGLEVDGNEIMVGGITPLYLWFTHFLFSISLSSNHVCACASRIRISLGCMQLYIRQEILNRLW